MLYGKLRFHRAKNTPRERTAAERKSAAYAARRRRRILHDRILFYSGQKVLLQGQDGKKTKTRIRGIEIGGRKAGVAADTPAALYLKDIEPDCIRRGDVIRNRE